MDDDPAVNRPGAAHRDPFVAHRIARRAHGSGREAQLDAVGAALHAQLVTLCPVPVGFGFGVGIRERFLVLRHTGAYSPQRTQSTQKPHPRSNTAPFGTPAPLVTSTESQSRTWHVDVPRIWRTPSQIRLKPCTYASDREPPDVFVGGPPSGHSRLPASAKRPASPGSTKPNSCSDTRMSGVKAS